MSDIGIMQGRLSMPRPGRAQAFPWNTWQHEFALARDCRLDAIEWLLTAETPEENPLWASAGIAAIHECSAGTGVRVRSVCADYFLSKPFVRVGEAERIASIAALEQILRQAGTLGAAVVLVPVLEANEVRTEEDADVLLACLAGPIEVATVAGVRIGLETDMPARDTVALIERAGSPALGAYYDTGNAAAIGRHQASDLRTLAPHLCGVHIKDRPRGGPNVPLGQGDVDFAVVFDALADVGYTGPLILETAAGDVPGESARRNAAFVRAHLARTAALAPCRNGMTTGRR